MLPPENVSLFGKGIAVRTGRGACETGICHQRRVLGQRLFWQNPRSSPVSTSYNPVGSESDGPKQTRLCGRRIMKKTVRKQGAYVKQKACWPQLFSLTQNSSQATGLDFTKKA
jgi:hypothetical protein